MFRTILNRAVANCGNQENFSFAIDVSASCLSKKMKGEVGWNEKEIDKIFELSEFCDVCSGKHKKEMDALTETIRVILEGRGE